MKKEEFTKSFCFVRTRFYTNGGKTQKAAYRIVENKYKNLKEKSFSWFIIVNSKNAFYIQE
jgi:hypothetical protein